MIDDLKSLQSGQVCPGLRFGETQRKDDVAANQPRQEVILLLFRACCQNGGSAAAGPNEGDADATEFFLDDILVDTAAALATVFFGPADANPALVAHLPVHFSSLRPASPSHVARSLRSSPARACANSQRSNANASAEREAGSKAAFRSRVRGPSRTTGSSRSCSQPAISRVSVMSASALPCRS